MLSILLENGGGIIQNELILNAAVNAGPVVYPQHFIHRMKQRVNLRGCLLFARIDPSEK